MAERRFKIVCAGWRCYGFWKRTLESIENQSVDNWDVWITYDGGDDEGPIMEAWCDEHGPRWNITVNDVQRFAVRNQYEAITALAPADDDIIVFLDLDGDQLAHKHVLRDLGRHYSDGTLLTYGSYQPVPPSTTCSPAVPFPPDVVAANSYRKHMLTAGCCFNHLRTMSGRVFKAIPPKHFHWVSGPKRGQWYVGGTDYIFMVAGLELAGGRYKCIPQVLCLYNHANPNADYLHHPADADACTQDYLRRPPLAPLPASNVHRPTGVPMTATYLSAEERREVLRDYGQRHRLSVLIETGTNDGMTPWTLKDDFEELFTIELGDRQWRAATKMFANVEHVHCLHGDSAVVLPSVLTTVGRPALIWLDGHWSGGDTAHGSEDTPVLAELEAIFATGVPHVVLVDDARLFDGMPLHDEQPNWPHIDTVAALAARNGYQLELVDDIIRLVPLGTAIKMVDH